MAWDGIILPCSLTVGWSGKRYSSHYFFVTRGPCCSTAEEEQNWMLMERQNISRFFFFNQWLLFNNTNTLTPDPYIQKHCSKLQQCQMLEISFFFISVLSASKWKSWNCLQRRHPAVSSTCLVYNLSCLYSKDKFILPPGRQYSEESWD